MPKVMALIAVVVAGLVGTFLLEMTTSQATIYTAAFVLLFVVAYKFFDRRQDVQG
jgi:hypothetical protein